VGRPGTNFDFEGTVMRWPFLSPRPTPSPVPDLTAVAEAAYVHGATSATECERTRCKTILQSPIADQNRPAAELLAFGTEMDAPAAVRLLTELANLGEAQQRTGPVADHYVQAARTINERKATP